MTTTDMCEQILYDCGLDTPAQAGRRDIPRLLAKAEERGARDQFLAWMLEQPRLRFGVRSDLTRLRFA